MPFVDIINTMSDPSIPLTVEEWEEWGNPNEEKWFHTMMAYSPYDNVSPSLPYPHMLITGGKPVWTERSPEGGRQNHPALCGPLCASRALLTPRVKPGPRYRCGRST